MQQSFDADNQQASLCELSWLGGIIDGEGCITMKKVGKLINKMQSVSPAITIINTNPIIINKIKFILKKWNIAFYEHQNQPTGHKNIYSIQVHGYKRAIRFLELITSYLVSKQQQAKLLHKFCSSRLEKLYQVYSDEERDTCLQIWKLNGRGTTFGKSQKPQRLNASPLNG